MPLDLIAPIVVAEPIHIDAIVEEAAFVVARGQEMLLAGADLLVPGLAAVAAVPVVDVTAIAAAGKVGPFEAVGAAVVDAAAGGDRAAGGEDERGEDGERESGDGEMHCWSRLVFSWPERDGGVVGDALTRRN